jgi:predicted transposase/invertase (TIGR01784 family)
LIDNISKFLIEQYSTDFATWLLGRAIPLTVINPTELNVEPIRADAVMLLSALDVILHTEFQTVPDDTMPFRMADYYLRLRRKFPEREIQQVVIYLKPTSSELVHQTSYQTPVMTHSFRVIRLWEEPVEAFLNNPGLLPYAVLSRGTNKEEILARVVRDIEQIPDTRAQHNLVAATSILAGLQLGAETISRLIRSPVMRESTMYQAILQEGRTTGERALVLRQLTRKLGNVSPELLSRVSALSVERVEALGEALLDFTSVVDLEEWLDS